MASDDYIPSPDADFRTWAEAFAGGISSNYATYMLTSAQAASIQGVVDDFVAKLAIATNEATRTKATIIDKDNSRHVAESLCRQYAMLIKDNAGISDGDKINIGVRPVNPNRTPIDCPQTSPLVNVVAATPGSHTVRFSDSMDPEKRAKPFGASELQLFLAITADDQAPLTDAKFYAKVTKNPVAVEFSQDDDGKLATYYARWASVRGEVGPWSLPVSMRIAA